MTDKIIVGLRENKARTNTFVHDAARSAATALGGEVVTVDRYNGVLPEGTRVYFQRGSGFTLPIKQCIREGIPYVISDGGYFSFGDGPYAPRRDNHSFTFNGLNGRGVVPPPFNAPRAKPTLKPWKKGPIRKILICGQVEGDAALEGRDWQDFLEAANKEARRAFPEAGIVIRLHPKMTATGVPECPLEDALKDADYLIAYSSTTAVEAVVEGIPTYVASQLSLAYPMAAHTIGEVCTPERDEWLHGVSYRQWRQEEIESGEMWEWLGTGLEAAAESLRNGNYYFGFNGRSPDHEGLATWL